MNSIDLFPIKIYKDHYSKTSDIKNNLFSKLDKVFSDSEMNNNVFMKNGTVCSYHSFPDLHKKFPDETREVIDFVETCAREYWKICGYYEGLEPFVYQVWANKTPKGGYVESHLHGNMPFTAILYVEANPQQGNLFLENPLETLLMTQPISPDIKYPIGEEISINSGDFIMFPGYLRHSVRPNQLEDPRLILAFNIGSKGIYWSSQWNKG